MKKSYFPLNDTFINIPIAHRGLHSETVSENSMESFKLAIEKGFNIEIDVHLLKDKNIAVIHDYNIIRVCGEDKNISSLSKEELKDYPLTLSKEIIPTLDEVLNLVNGQVGLLIEIKCEEFNEEFIDLIIKELSTYKYKDKIAIQSFNPKVIKYFKEKCSDYSCGILSSFKLGYKNKIIDYLLSRLKLVNWGRADFISYCVDHLPLKHVTRYKNKGYKLLTWTINTMDKYDLAKKVADNVIFERIDI